MRSSHIPHHQLVWKASVWRPVWLQIPPPSCLSHFCPVWQPQCSSSPFPLGWSMLFVPGADYYERCTQSTFYKPLHWREHTLTRRQQAWKTLSWCSSRTLCASLAWWRRDCAAQRWSLVPLQLYFFPLRRHYGRRRGRSLFARWRRVLWWWSPWPGHTTRRALRRGSQTSRQWQGLQTLSTLRCGASLSTLPCCSPPLQNRCQSPRTCWKVELIHFTSTSTLPCSTSLMSTVEAPASMLFSTSSLTAVARVSTTLVRQG